MPEGLSPQPEQPNKDEKVGRFEKFASFITGNKEHLPAAHQEALTPTSEDATPRLNVSEQRAMEEARARREAILSRDPRIQEARAAVDAAAPAEAPAESESDLPKAA